VSCHTIEIATIALLPTIITSHPLILIQPADNNSMVNAEVQDHIENELKDEGAMQDEEEEDEQEQEPDLDKADRAFLMTFKMGPSKTKQIGHMLTHLKIFLATLSPSVTLLSFSIKHINDKFVTAWADYLGKDALRQDGSKQPIKVQTALNYLSAFKQFVVLCMVGRDHKPPHCLDDKMYGCYHASIWTAKRAANRGVALVKPKDCATAEDRRALAALCIWNGDAESAEFLLFTTAAFQSAGRGGEMASLSLKSLTTTTIKEKYSDPYSVLQLDFERDKTSTQSSFCIFPDRDTVLNDFNFTLGYFLVLSQHSSCDLLPNFHDKLAYDKQGRVDSSKVSSLFTALIVKLFKLADQYLNLSDDDEKMESYDLNKLNQNLRSHGGRKATMNTLAESAVPYYVWIHRTGLLVRNLNTLFDYLSQSKRTDIASGKTLSGWTHSVNNEIYGGVPPSLDCLESSDLAKQAASILFTHHIAHGLDKEVAYLLFASIILNLDKFSTIINDEPHNKYATHKHPFILSFEDAMAKANIPSSLLESWKLEISKDYFSSNVLGLPFKDLPVDVRGKLQIDSRTFFEILDTITHLQLQERAAIARLTTAHEIHCTQSAADFRLVNTKLDKILNGLNIVGHENEMNAPAVQVNSVDHNLPLISKEDPSNEGYKWPQFADNFTSVNVSLKDKYVLFHSSKFDNIYLNRLDKREYTRRLGMDIRKVIACMQNVLNEPPCPRGTLGYEEWMIRLRQQGQRAEELLMEKLMSIPDFKKSKKQSPPLCHIINPAKPKKKKKKASVPQLKTKKSSLLPKGQTVSIGIKRQDKKKQSAHESQLKSTETLKDSHAQTSRNHTKSKGQLKDSHEDAGTIAASRDAIIIGAGQSDLKRKREESKDAKKVGKLKVKERSV
jgi:hypothetical protein